MKRAILNVAVPGGGHGDSWYQKGAQRLADSLDSFNEPADQLFWTDWIDRPYADCKYCFKADAFLEARHRGYDQAMWIDSSCFLVKPLDGAWAIVDDQGYLLGMEGWTVGRWCSPEVRDLLGRTQEELDNMTLVEGKLMGLDFHSGPAHLFLDTWDSYARMGAFHGSHDNHRHDITCAGIIASDLGLTLTEHLIEFQNDPNHHPDVYVRCGPA